MENNVKRSGINLKKGSSISLVKEEKPLEQICLGLNWGTIQKNSLFGILKNKVSVDLDASVTLFDGKKNAVETVFFNRLRSSDNAIRHSGDDRIGDLGPDDDNDNEVIEVNLTKLNPNIEQIVFYLNSYKQQDFGDIPYTKIRIVEGTRKNIESVFATFNLSTEKEFAGKVSMVMAKIVRNASQNWEFVAIGEAVGAKDINDTIQIIKEKYL
ncbi:MAG: TerD family protein [Cytophagaceae bacterium]|jgi:tellurium resistance protein TerZ|nr:TerD family protein [Cytophagaceae bacterium]